VQRTYALGWGVHDYRGRRVVSHGGSIDGFRSQVTLLPDEKLGIVVLTNLGRTPLPSAVTNSLLDLLLGAQKRDWNRLLLEVEKKRKDEQKKQEAVRQKKRKRDTKPSLDLAGYAGSFDEAAHGRIDVRAEEGALKLDWGKHRDLGLEHWHLDTFRIQEPPGQYPEAWGDRLLVFRFSTAGEVEGFSYLGHEFRKVKPKK
jgi:Domain of unknown function (DUF3471)/Beta-lactamase